MKNGKKEQSTVQAKNLYLREKLNLCDKLYKGNS